MQRKKSTKCYIALLTGHHKISVHDAAICHKLPDLFFFAHLDCIGQRIKLLHVCWSFFIARAPWIKFNMSCYLVFHITIMIEHVLYFLINQIYLKLRGFHITLWTQHVLRFLTIRKIKHIFLVNFWFLK